MDSMWKQREWKQRGLVAPEFAAIPIPRTEPQPNSPEAELSLLGCCVLQNRAITEVEAGLGTLKGFYSERSQIIWEAILATFKRYGKVDPVSLKDGLGDKLAAIGGIDTVAALIGEVPNAEAYSTYLDIVRRKAVHREYLGMARKIYDLSMSDANLSEVQLIADKFRSFLPSDTKKTLSHLIGEAIESMGLARTLGPEMEFGWDALDRYVGGLRRKLLYVVGGKTSQGKTTVVVNTALHNMKKGRRVLLASLENPDQIPLRLASAESGHPLGWFLKPERVGEVQYAQVRDAVKDLAKYKDLILPIGAASIAEMRAAADKFRPDIIVLDYVQRYAHRYCDGSTGSTAHEVGKVASDFADMAIEHNAVGILLSQVTVRGKEGGSKGKPPELTDLKESGDLENYADVVLMLYWKYRDTLDAKYDPEQYQIMIAKNKLGPCGDVTLRIDPNTLRISSWYEVGNGSGNCKSQEID